MNTDLAEMYKVIFALYMKHYAKEVQAEYRKIYEESVITYADIIIKNMDTADLPIAVFQKFKDVLQESKTSGILPSYLMTEEFYVVKDIVTFKSLNKFSSMIYDFCVEKMESEFYTCDEKIARDLTNALLDFIQESMWVDAIPSNFDMEIRKN